MKEGGNLESAFLWMFTATSEQTRRFDSEIPHFLFATIQCASDVFGFHLILFLLESFLLCRSQSLLLLFLGGHVLVHRPKVAHVEIRDLGAVALSFQVG